MIEVDRIDRQILHYLSKDSRVTNKYLASKIGVAPSTCFERVRLLQEKGVIKGFHAELDMEKLGLSLKAMISLKLKGHSKKEFEAFYHYIHSLAPVIAIYHLSGAVDFLLQVEVRDSRALRAFILDAFASRPEVLQIESSIVYEKKRKYSCDALLLDSAEAKGN